MLVNGPQLTKQYNRQTVGTHSDILYDPKVAKIYHNLSGNLFYTLILFVVNCQKYKYSFPEFSIIIPLPFFSISNKPNDNTFGNDFVKIYAIEFIRLFKFMAMWRDEIPWLNDQWTKPRAPSHIKTVFPGMGISIIKIKRSWHRLIFKIVIPMLLKHIYVEIVKLKRYIGAM